MCEIYLDFLKYLKSMILDKEKIVCALTDQVKQFANTITNIVEYSHVTLNNWLRNNKGDFCRGSDYVNQMIKNQHNEIHTYFCQSIIVLEHWFKDNILYSQLV